jgi:UDP-N-acetylmuramate--alanine ligase
MKAFHVSNTMPLDVGVIHFVGIGGIGMSGIAEILHNLGYKVQGSDQSGNANVDRLREMGITVHVGHDAAHVQSASVVVKSTAVGWDNVEIIAARKRDIPVLKRSEMLAEVTRLKTTIAIAGTHGKTTTTSFTATLLEHGKLDPTVINGGILNAYGSNAHLGASDWMVVEADESDGTFIRIPASVAVVTNIDPEHLDHWGDFAALKQAFVTLLQNLPFYGFAVLCIDHPEVQQLKKSITDRRVISYGFSPQADMRAVNLRKESSGSRFDVEIHDRHQGTMRVLENIRLLMPGEHNVLNALAAMTVAINLGIDDASIREAFLSFRGVKRRFTQTGEVDGIRVIDDYAHHPVEIAATLKAARQAVEPHQGRVLAVMQPHRFSRLHDLFGDFCTCFNEADKVWVSEVFAAGETPVDGVDHEALVRGLQDAGHKDPRVLNSPDDIAGVIHAEAREGDVVIFLGAGSVTHWAYALPEKLAALRAESAKNRSKGAS